MWVVVSKVHCQLLLQALPFLHWGYFPCNSCGPDPNRVTRLLLHNSFPVMRPA